jgi:hypothetical protein
VELFDVGVSHGLGVDTTPPGGALRHQQGHDYPKTKEESAHYELDQKPTLSFASYLRAKRLRDGFDLGTVELKQFLVTLYVLLETLGKRASRFDFALNLGDHFRGLAKRFNKLLYATFGWLARRKNRVLRDTESIECHVRADYDQHKADHFETSDIEPKPQEQKDRREEREDGRDHPSESSAHALVHREIRMD